MAKTVRCRLGWHKWHRQVTDDGERYLACSRCGKLGEVGPPTPVDPII